MDRSCNHVAYSEHAEDDTSISTKDVRDVNNGYATDSTLEPKSSLKNVGSKRSGNKRCRVCGDRALGYNFNVVTCESCKAFFRRNALKRKEFRCAFDDNCNVSLASRRFCQKCRLKKCFEVGMKKEWISTHPISKSTKGKKMANQLTNNDLVEVQDLLNFNNTDSVVISNECNDSLSDQPYISTNDKFNTVITSKNSLISFSRSSGSSSNSSSISSSTVRCTCVCTCGAAKLQAVVAQQDKAVNTDVAILHSDNPLHTGPAIASQEIQPINWASHFSTTSADRLPDIHDNESYYNLPWVNQKMTDSGNLSTVNAASFFSVSTSCNDFLARTFSPHTRNTPQPHFMEITTPAVAYSRQLSDRHRDMLAELISANEIMNEPMENFVARRKTNGGSITDFVNLMDIATRRIITMTQRLTGFKKLCQADQIALLKGGCVELMVLRGVMAFDPEKDSWLGPKSHLIKMDPVHGLKTGISEEYKRYFYSFNNSLRTNESVMLILGAVALFMPDRPNVADKQLIRAEQFEYNNLLQCYLNTIYNEHQSRLAFSQLCKNMAGLCQLGQRVIGIFSHVNPEELEPLLLEMFDLK